MTMNDIRGLTKNSTADDVLAGIDLTGKRAIVTGAASGVGVETARALARAGAEVTIAVRNTAKGHEVADDIEATTGHPVTVAELEGYGGRYFEDNREARVVPEIYDVIYGVLPWALDPEAASRLWDVSTALVDAEAVRLGLEPQQH